MTGEVKIPFPIGSEVWAIGPMSHEETITCTECAGAKFVTLVLGSGARHTLACEVCKIGYSNPTGVNRVRVFEFIPKTFICEALYSLDHYGAARYKYLGNVVDAADLFATYEECLLACQVRNVKLKEEEDRRTVANIASKRANLAFSVSYWRKKVKELERDLSAARVRLEASKEKERAK
jgi:hypothetical protein